jgi:(p)ppGpp synthase/HD superfamily hydrolase
MAAGDRTMPDLSEDKPNPNPDGMTPAGGGKGKEAEGQAEKKEFTQAELDKLFADTRKQGRESLQREILEKAGFKTVDEMLAAVNAHKKSEEEKLSELEKAKKASEKAEADKKKLEEEVRTMRLERNFEKMVKTLELEFANPKAGETAFKLLNIETAGKDDEGMEEAVKALAKDHSYLFSDAEPEQINDATRKGKGDQKNLKKETIESKRQSGRYTSI